MRSGLQVHSSPRFRVLSEGHIEALHLATLEVLERTGVEVLEEEALSLLREEGADVEGTSRVHIPPYLVKKALSTAPEKVTLCTRDGRRTVCLEDSKCFFGTGSDCPTILDPFTGKRRPFTKEDVGRAALLADALPNLDFHMSLGLVSDAPRLTSDLHQFEAMLLNTRKPIVFTAHNRENMADMISMAEVVAEGADPLRRNPFICLYAEPVTPLKHIGLAVKKLLLAAEKQIPVVYTPCPMAGGTAPCTLAGTLVVANAEVLSGLVLHQLKKPGAPFIGGGVPSIMDMSSAILSYGAPELSLLSAAFTELMHSYALPMFGTCGCSDAKILDEQAAIEATLSILMSALSGANLIHDIGFLEYALLGSLEMVVLSDEVIGMTKRILRGIEVNEDTLALEVIHQVGPGGHFLAEEHTLRHFRKEYFSPRFLDRQNYAKWMASGEPPMRERLNKEVRRILTAYTPEEIPPEKRKRIASLISEAEQRKGIRG